MKSCILHISEVAFLRAMNGVVSFIKPPLSLLLNYPPLNLKLIEYYYLIINAFNHLLSFSFLEALPLVLNTKVIDKAVLSITASIIR